MTIAAIVLAAGEGSRFAASERPMRPGRAGPHKLEVPFRGRPLVAWSVDAACEAGFGAVYVVTGAVDLTGVLTDSGLAAPVVLVANPDWAHGQASSVRAGVAEADRAGHDAVVVGLGDQPLIPAEAWRRVGAQVDAAHPLVAATYGGHRRNPVGLHRSIWPDLPLTGDAGARVLMSARPELVTEVACPGEPADVDTQEDLTRWS